MTLFEKELFGSHGFSLISANGLHAIISANPQLLLPTKSVVVYARKQSHSTIFEWQVKEKGWYLYVGEYPTGWEKKVKVVNLPTPMKKSSVSRFAKPKPAKKGDDSFEPCSNIVPYKGKLPPIGNIVLEGSPPPSARTCFNRRPTVGKPRPTVGKPRPFAPQPSTDAPPSSRTCNNKRKTSLPPPSAIAERRVCYL